MIMSRCLTWFPNWFVYKNPIYNINRFVLQGSGSYLEGCLTVKNQWELLTGDDGVHANKISIWKKQLLDVADTVLAVTMFR